MKKLATIEAGTVFVYGGMAWVKLDEGDGTTLALAEKCVSDRAFDEDNKNDWRQSSLREWANGEFLDGLCENGADRASFADVVTDLTADDGMGDYGFATDKIALITCDLYRQYRALIPAVDDWWWTATAWTTRPAHSYNVRNVHTTGTLTNTNAYGGNCGFRPLCNMKSEILVSVPGEETETARADALREVVDDILNTLHALPVDDWGDALGLAVSSLVDAKFEAAEIAEEESAIRREREA